MGQHRYFLREVLSVALPVIDQSVLSILHVDRNIAGQSWNPQGHRLRDTVIERFEQAGVDVEITPVIQGDEPGVVTVAGEFDSTAQVFCVGYSTNFLNVGDA